MKRCILLVLLIIAATGGAYAQNLSNAGKEFWVAFGRNDTIQSVRSVWVGDLQRFAPNVELILRVTTVAQTKVTLHFSANPSLDTTYIVAPGAIYDIHLSLARAQAAYTATQYYNPNYLSMRSVFVTATQPISLVAISSAPHSVEATLVQPVTNLGKNHIHVGMHPYTTWIGIGRHSNGFVVVATEDNTNITFTAPYSTAPNPVNLKKGEVYFYCSPGTTLTNNPMGIQINADKNIALFQNSTSSQVYIAPHANNNYLRNNYQFEQTPPVEHWGKRFIMPTNDWNAGMVRVFANDYPTVVNIYYSNGAVQTETLTFGSQAWQSYRDIWIDAENQRTARAAYIVADKPVSVETFHIPYYETYTYNGNIVGMPSQPGAAWLPPVDQRTESVLVSPLDFNGYHVYIPMDHYMMFITPTASKSKTMFSINGGPPQVVPDSLWKADNIGGSGYSFGRFYFGQSYAWKNPPIQLNTTALVSNPDGIIVLAYGQGSYTNYFYSVGTGGRDLTKTYSISGTVSGWPDNEGIAVKYTIDGGTQQVTTTSGGAYIITGIPAGANVIITASEQPDYIGTVADFPSTSMVTSDITGKNIYYTYNSTIAVEYAKVFACHEESEIDILGMMGYNCQSVTLKMIDQPKYADSIPGLNSNGFLPYSLHVDFQGKDNMMFSLRCGQTGAIDTIKLHVYVIKCPDNITTPECSGDAASSNLTIRLRSKTQPSASGGYDNFINEMDVPLVGDIYGDGQIKILAAQSRNPGANATDWLSEGIVVFDGKTGAWEKTIPVVPFHTGSGTRAIAKVNGKTKLFIASGGKVSGFGATDNHIVCYDLAGDTIDWVSEVPYIPITDYIAANILIADMNHDGTPEVIAGNKIFNAATGKLLLDMSMMSGLTYGYGAGFLLRLSGIVEHLPYFPAVADMANDGVLEFVAGPNIYKIHIPVHANSTAGSSIKLHRTVKAAPGGNLHNVGDGATVVADLDGDGYLDVIVTRNSGLTETEGTPYLFAWCGRTGEMFGNAVPIIHVYAAGDTVSHYGHGPSIPVVGDLDGCGTPEIVVSTSGRLHVFKLNKSTKTLEEIAKFTTNENSGAIAPTLFDFDHDYKQELVFHDFDRLHILSLQGDTLVDMVASSPQLEDCFTFAQNEYPIVADVTGDGRANIVVFGSDDSNDAKFGKGYLYIFESQPEAPWAPARKVWNQWAYNAVNIKNDLTVPRMQANPAIMYFDTGGGTGGGKRRPYNAFLQQHTLFDNDGHYVWALPNLQWAVNPSMTLDGDSIVITGKITNQGDVGMLGPVYITVYKNEVSALNVVKLDSIPNEIYPGETVDISITINNFSAYSDVTKVLIGINDKEGMYPFTLECDVQQRHLFTFPVKKYVQVVACYPQVEIDLLKMVETDCSQIGIVVIRQPSHASFISNLNANQKLPYLLTDDFRGRDSLELQVMCLETNTLIVAMKLYFTVIDCPDNIAEADCFGTSEATSWGIDEVNFLQSDVTINAYGQPYVGDVDGCGRNEVLVWNRYLGSGSSYGAANELLIFNDSLILKYTIPLGGQTGANSNSPPDLAIAFAKTNPANKAADIFVIVGTSTTSPNGAMRCYTLIGNTWTQKWNTPAQIAYSASINIGDINNDGNVMLYADHKIFNASTGAVLLTLPDTPKGKRNGSAAIMNLLADMDNNGTLEAVAGTRVYKLNISNLANETGNSYEILYELPLSAISDVHPDGYVSVADVNFDGYLDVIIATNTTNLTTQRPRIVVWNPQTESLIGDTIATGYYANPAISRVFVGDVDSCGYPELVVAVNERLFCHKWDTVKLKFVEKWRKTITDPSGMTYMCMFDFNQNGKQEIVYRDEQRLRIIDGATGASMAEIPCYSSTVWEGPVVADLNGSGHAQIIVTGNSISSSTFDQTYLRAYTSSLPGAWAPARSVWNQYGYNAVNINDDLTVPRYQLNPSTVFPNGKRPFNSFLKQPTMLNKNGDLFWPLANAETDASLSSISVSGNATNITVGVINKGSTALVPPFYVTVYKNAIAGANIIATQSENIQINPGDTAYITVFIPDLTVHQPVINLLVSVNDNGVVFPVQPECDDGNNNISFLNPFLSRLMKKDAKILIPNAVQQNGTYPNPVSVLFNEEIEYTLTAVNVNPNPGTVIISDTLPLYLNYVPASASDITLATFSNGVSNGLYPRNYVTWKFTGVAPMDTRIVSFKATPNAGVCASQPLFINRAYIAIPLAPNDTLHIPTGNSTYHQGAGVSLITFSQGFGGAIYNAGYQALDYSTSPRKGILITPDEGYRFDGWSHDDYWSLRGKRISAQHGIMCYDTLTVYGSIDLRANFAPIEYPIAYYLNGGYVPSSPSALSALSARADLNIPLPTFVPQAKQTHYLYFNIKERSKGEIGNPQMGKYTGLPLHFTIETSTFTLATPTKEGDVFIGWTGSNGDEPQLTVTIPKGSTGERAYYANFLHSGREENVKDDSLTEDRIWANKDYLYVYTLESGAFVRIFTPDGVLYKIQALPVAGETKIKLQPGIYIVTLNNGIGKKIIIL